VLAPSSLLLLVFQVDPQAPRPAATASELAAASETLPAGDGWASVATTVLPKGTTGGATAGPLRTVVVASRRELVAALNFPDATPKIILISGTIDANVDEAGKVLSCEAYARPDPMSGEPYSIRAFLAAYDPAGRAGRVNPSGPQERARVASAAAQAAHVRIRIPANTTIYGLGRTATVRGDGRRALTSSAESADERHHSEPDLRGHG
jgi:pectate lyase